MSKSILLVEDNPRDSELTQLALRKAGLDEDIVVLRDGAEALDYLFQRGKFAGVPMRPPALILLDLKLPKVDGLQVLEHLKRDRLTSSIPTVMLTASREDSDLTRSSDLGVSAYVVKPIGFKDFVRTFQELALLQTARDQGTSGIEQL